MPESRDIFQEPGTGLKNRDFPWKTGTIDRYGSCFRKVKINVIRISFLFVSAQAHEKNWRHPFV